MTWYQPENTEEDIWAHAVYGATVDVASCCKLNPLTASVDVRACIAELHKLSSWELYWEHAPLLLLFWGDQIAGFAPRTGIRSAGPANTVEAAAQDLIEVFNRLALTSMSQEERYCIAIEIMNQMSDGVIEAAMVFTAALLNAALGSVCATPADLIKSMQLVGGAQAKIAHVPDEVTNHCARGIVRGHAHPERLEETWPCLVEDLTHNSPGWTVQNGLSVAVLVMRQAFLRLRELRTSDDADDDVTGYLPDEPSWVGAWWDRALDPANSNADLDACMAELTSRPETERGKAFEVLSGAAVALRSLLPYVTVHALSLEAQLRPETATA